MIFSRIVFFSASMPTMLAKRTFSSRTCWIAITSAPAAARPPTTCSCGPRLLCAEAPKASSASTASKPSSARARV